MEVISSTGTDDIGGYTEREFNRLGVGSAERNNGILLLLALDNYYNGAPGGDYYIGWGSGFSSGEGSSINSARSWRALPMRLATQATNMAAAIPAT